jgi:(S)-2-hydroxyglutarate dehydrogenase
VSASDFVVIGGGVIGLSIARELKRRYADSRVTVLEKEPDTGRHASGRNSGVLHAGFYYTPDSLKARLTRVGNAALTEYCQARDLPINPCGKLVVTRDASELPALDELLRRGRVNGIALEPVDARQAQAIEPRARTFERALFSPTTASVDPARVVAAMTQDARAEGVRLETGRRFLRRAADAVVTDRGRIDAGYVVNAAGLYADRIARAYGFSHRYRILPFKGLYLYSDEPAGAIRTHIYPVPDLRNPFLGVHFTVAVDGRIKIGPTAIPAFWRENYRGLDGFRAGELWDIVRRQARLLLRSDFDFKRLAIEEIRKHSRARMVALARGLARGVEAGHYRHWGRPGIRAQLLDIERNRLEMDFVIEGDARSLHVLNAVSPAFTCALPFAAHVCDEIGRRLGERPARGAGGAP